MRSEPSIRLIAEAVAEFHEVPYEALLSRRRTHDLVHARHLVMYLARELTVRSYPDIGRALGRDHTTVIHGVASIERRIAEDAGLAGEVEEIKLTIGATMIAVARSAHVVTARPLLDLDPVRIGERVLNEPNGLTTISMEELLTLATAAAAGADTAERAAMEAEAPPSPSSPPPPPPLPVVKGDFVAAARELLAALTAVDNASFEDRGAVAAARTRLRAARAAFERWLNTIPGAAGTSTKEKHDAHHAHA